MKTTLGEGTSEKVPSSKELRINNDIVNSPIIISTFPHLNIERRGPSICCLSGLVLRVAVAVVRLRQRRRKVQVSNISLSSVLSSSLLGQLFTEKTERQALIQTGF